MVDVFNAGFLIGFLLGLVMNYFLLRWVFRKAQITVHFNMQDQKSFISFTQEKMVGGGGENYGKE